MMGTEVEESMKEILSMVVVAGGEKMVQPIRIFPGHPEAVDFPPIVEVLSPDLIPSVVNGQDRILIFQNGL